MEIKYNQHGPQGQKGDGMEGHLHLGNCINNILSGQNYLRNSVRNTKFGYRCNKIWTNEEK